ncbi:MAG: N-formylglutamate amidohydrolase [Patescibacteria group bacterium]|jgi:N-formylglutamate amidohydrolase|nr:N-formylglutamate amidohydrolase [Patescibacteria group bacterium]
MKILEGSGNVPVIYSAHHASHEYGGFSERVALTEGQCERFSDYGTAITVPLNGLWTLIAMCSRALGDLNRAPDSPTLFPEKDFGKPKNNIWLPGLELTDLEKIELIGKLHKPYHEKIVDLLAQRNQPTFVVAWDNTANYPIGRNEAGEVVTMPPIILSNRGSEESAHAHDGGQTSCDPVFMELLADYFRIELEKRQLPHEIHLNLVFKGGYVCSRYSTSSNQTELEAIGISTVVQSLQVEYNTAITHDQETLKFDAVKANLLKSAFSSAIELAIEKYSSSN